MNYPGGMWDFIPSVDTLEVPDRGEAGGQTLFLPWQTSKYQTTTKLFYHISFLGNNYQPVQSFCWSETTIFRENITQADFLEPLLPGQLQLSSSSPRCLSFAQRWYSNQWSNREMLLLLVENYTQYPALLVWNITSWGNFWRPQLELFMEPLLALTLTKL